MPAPKLRSTKIIATLGPVTDSGEMIGKLIAAGVNVFRINMSHAKHDWARELVFRIRRKATEMDKHVAVLFDLQGPSIRTGDLPAPLGLKAGDKIEFRNQAAASEIEYSTTVNYDGLMEDVAVGNTLVVDNGALLMKVVEVRPERILCDVIAGGTFGSRRHINLPGVRLRLPALTEKDLADLDVAIECDTDYVAMSFVRDAAHVEELRGHILSRGSQASIIAKIEDQQAVRAIDDIILAADVIMVARGDLGIEVHVEELPVIQRRIIRSCHRLGRRVIVATHMLESMINQPTPTRAEVTDVSNAVYEQCDAVMLSGETSVGQYPILCIESLDRIALRMERSGNLKFASEALLQSDKQKVIRAAVSLADSMHNAKLMIFTRRGLTAVQAGMLRPERSPIFAFTNDTRVARSLALARGIQAFESPFLNDPKGTIDAAVNILRSRGFVQEGDPLIVIADSIQGQLLADSILCLRA